MMIGSWIASPSPGNEQRGRWSSAAANAEGAYNISGVPSPAVDAMIAAILAAKTNEDFVAAVRALDRLLISGFYIVPLYYAPEQWIAYSAKLGPPGQDAAVRRRSFELVAQGALRSPRGFLGPIGPETLVRPIHLDCLGPSRFTAKIPAFEPWIYLDFLDSLVETRLINGLRRKKREKFFLSVFPLLLHLEQEILPS